ncbi:peptidoglycan-binding protein [Streptomyces pseudogriseolus]|uniref:peptidoglycan-binding domain-containing protein n=1 Tax=Streptomyces pseudogriseolus TaxID=36817 RepID=UPI003FA26902
MDQPNGHPCPECGATRHADNTPSCACTRRAADALRDARTAETAAAEDFDPLRIRPYVELSSTTPDGSPEATEPGPQAAGDGDAGSPEATTTSRAVRPDAGEPGGLRAPGPADAAGPADTGVTANGAGAGHTGGPADDATPQPASAPGAGGSVGTGEPAGTEAPHTGAAANGASAAHPGSRAGATTRPAGTGAPHTGTGATGATPGTAHHASAPGADQAPTDAPHPASPDVTMTLRAVRPDGTGEPGATPAGGADAPSLATPLAPGTAQPNADDLGLFDDATRPLRTVSAGVAAPRPDDPAPRSRRRRGALIVASGAAVAVLGAAGWASGLFSYDTPSRNTAAPDDVRAGLPDASSAAPSAEPSSEPPSVSPGASASVSDSPSASASASGSPSPSASSSAPSASASAEPSATPSADAESSAPAGDPEPEEPVDTAPVLRRGDRGPEVVELQQRLRQVWLYQGDMNGQYGRRVEEAVRHYQWSRGINEELGVYGPQTRARLEAETGTP